MNTPLPSIAPVNAAQPAAANPQDAAAPEVPFSQVLSGEMAHRASEGTAEENAQVAADIASYAVVVADAAAPKLDVAAATGATDTATDPLPADYAPTLPDAMLALAQPIDPRQPAPVPVAGNAGVVPGEAATQDIAPQAGGKPAAALSRFGADAERTNTRLASAVEATSARATAPLLPDTAQASDRSPDFMTAMAAAQAPQVAAALTRIDAGERLAPSVGSAAWGQALGDKVVWMATGGQQTASLTLNPPDLGPLRVVIHVGNDQATANFFAAQPEVRQALETALPRLREMMQDAGIQLGQATVGADTPRQQDASDRGPQRNVQPFIGNGQANEIDLPPTGVQRPQAGRGLVDTFA